jgi:hypothetical protein
LLTAAIGAKWPGAMRRAKPREPLPIAIAIFVTVLLVMAARIGGAASSGVSLDVSGDAISMIEMVAKRIRRQSVGGQTRECVRRSRRQTVKDLRLHGGDSASAVIDFDSPTFSPDEVKPGGGVGHSMRFSLIHDLLLARRISRIAIDGLEGSEAKLTARCQLTGAPSRRRVLAARRSTSAR